MAHSKTHLGNLDRHDNMNGKPAHTHIPRISTAANQIPGGGQVECGVCGLVLMDCDN